MRFLGKFEALIETKKRIAVATFYVAKTTNNGNLISATTAQELGLISLNLNKVSTTKNNNLDNILNKPGTNNPADYLSRHPTSTSSKEASMTEDYINLIARCSVPKTLTLDEVETATDSDKTLRGVRAAIKLNKWHYDLVKAFKPVKDELTATSKGVVLRGTRIVLPQSLQQRAVDIAHATHLGLSKTKALIREKVWFPKMDEMIQTTIKQCIPCQAVGKSNPHQPIESTEMPKGPWEKLHMDFYGPLPSGEYLLVVIDRYSINESIYNHTQTRSYIFCAWYSKRN